MKNGSKALFLSQNYNLRLSFSLRILLKYCSSPKVAKCFEKLEIHGGLTLVPIDLVVISSQRFIYLRQHFSRFIRPLLFSILICPLHS